MKLLDLFVEFVVKGQDKLKTAFQQTKEEAKQVADKTKASGDASANVWKTLAAMGDKARASFYALKDEKAKTITIGQRLNTTFKDLEKTSIGLKDAVNNVRFALAGAGLGLAGWVTAGFAGTTHAGALAAQFERLSQGIASIFVPWMETLIETIKKLANWFENLTRSEQAQLRVKIAWIAGIGLAIVLLPQLIGIVKALVTVFMTLHKGMLLLMANPLTIGLTALAIAFIGIKMALDDTAKSAENLADKLQNPSKDWTRGGFEKMPIFKQFEEWKKSGFLKKNKDELLKSLNEEMRDLAKKERDAIEAKANLPAWGLALAKFIPGETNIEEAAKSHEEAAKKAADRLEVLRRIRQEFFRGEKQGFEGDKGASKVVPQAGGPEAITATITRLQAAVNRQDYLKETADNTRQMAQGIAELVKQGGKPDPDNGNLVGAP